MICGKFITQSSLLKVFTTNLTNRTPEICDILFEFKISHRFYFSICPNSHLVINTVIPRPIVHHKTVLFSTHVAYVRVCEALHDDTMTLIHSPQYWPFVRGMYRSQVALLKTGQQCGGACMFPLMLNVIPCMYSRCNDENTKWYIISLYSAVTYSAMDNMLQTPLFSSHTHYDHPLHLACLKTQ